MIGRCYNADMNDNDSKLHKYILATVAYYDGFSYPLTAFEIWKYLIRIDYFYDSDSSAKFSLAEVFKQFQTDALLKYLESRNGFYFLKGRSELVELRNRNQKISADKLKRLVRVVAWFRFVPFVRMIGVTGGLAMKNAHAKSDWDLLVVTETGHIWTGRTLVTGLAQLLGKRRYGKKIVNRLCLNYFLTENSLEVMTKDLFSANEYMFLIPLFGADVYHRFQIKNQWIKKMKPSYGLEEISRLRMLKDDFFSERIRGFGEFLLGSRLVEDWLRKIEKKKIAKNPKTHREGSLVYAEDDALVFLPSPHGPIIFEKFKEKIEQLGIGH